MMGRVAVAVLLALGVAGCGGDDDGSGGDAGARDGGGRDAGGADGGAMCVALNGRCAEASECCDELACNTASTGDGYCVPPDDTCFVGADPGCCLDDADCADGERCHLAECRPGGEGVCKPLPTTAGECWSDRDCDPRTTCDGATLCPCGAMCDAADVPGACTPPPPTEG